MQEFNRARGITGQLNAMPYGIQTITWGGYRWTGTVSWPVIAEVMIMAQSIGIISFTVEGRDKDDRRTTHVVDLPTGEVSLLPADE